MKFKWYILFVRRNSETKVLNDIKNLASENKFSWINESILDLKFLESTNQKNVIPGYMFINCFIDKKLLDFLYSIKEVVGFLNYDRKNPDSVPVHLSNLEVNNFFSLIEKEKGKSDKKLKKSFENIKKIENESFKVKDFNIGDIVVIKEGVFKNNKGSVIQIKKNSLTVNIEFLGRFTPVSINFSHCEKI